jgi:hypothetical protein
MTTFDRYCNNAENYERSGDHDPHGKFKRYEEASYRALLIAEIEEATGHYHPSYNKLSTEALETLNNALNDN